MGHKKYNPKSKHEYDLIAINDALGQQEVAVNVCERCKKVYAEFKAQPQHDSAGQG